MPSKRSKRGDRVSGRSSNHRVDRYAEAVLAGTILAGPYVRAACERHERDRQRVGWIYRFDVERADHAIAFFEGVLRLPDLLDDAGQPVRFKLEPWQTFIVGSLFGWVDADGNRRFREAYIEVGKGNGKTPLCAGMGLYGLVMDEERAAEIYAAAADQDQANILFRDAVRIAQASPDLWPILSPSGGEHVWQLQHKPSLSLFKTFSRESGAKSGTRPHMGLLDELHEHGTPQISIKIRAGAKGRKQPLFVEITNSGFDRTSICWEHHEHSRKVMERVVTDDQWFAYVCALDEADDPLQDESCWPKANPNLGVSIRHEYLRRQVMNANNIPGETNTVVRLNFCVWTQQDIRAINMTAWQACPPRLKASELVGVPCFGGLDLGQTDDFTAWVRIWILPDGRVAVLPRFWIPRSAVERFPNRPSLQWERAGLLEITSGNATDYNLVQAAILEDCRSSGVRLVGYDRRFAEQMAQNLAGADIQMVDVPQGFALNEACMKLGALIASGELCHGHHEILTWMASNYVEHFGGQRGDRRPDKDAAEDKIDGIVALEMALMMWIRQPIEPEPAYTLAFIGGPR